MYMNCAAINIGGSAGKVTSRGASDPFSSRPEIFIANVGNGICTYEGTDVLFPEPGPDVVTNSTTTHAPGTGVCDVFGGP